MNRFEIICRAIHKELHSGGNGLTIDGQPHPVQVAVNNCRYIKFENKVFIQQDVKRWGVLADRVRRGEHITRITRAGKPWGYIDDEKIFDPLGGA